VERQNTVTGMSAKNLLVFYQSVNCMVGVRNLTQNGVLGKKEESAVCSRSSEIKKN
jgi:hypothetical protein